MADLSNLGLGDPFLGSNPYLEEIIGASQRDLVQKYNTGAIPASNAAAIRSGSFGNSGIEEMQRLDADQLQKNLGDVSSKYRFNDYTQQQAQYRWDQELNRNIYNDAYSQNMNNLQTGIGLLGTLGGYNANDAATATTAQNAPLGYYQQFAQSANAIGGNGGSTSTSTQAGTTSNPLTSAIGGAQLGNAAMSWWNNGNSSAPISQTNQTNFDNFGANNNWWGTA